MALRQFEHILEKLDRFIRRYYVNRLIKGLILFIGLSLAFILLIDVTEYIFRFGILGRKLLFFSAFIGLLVIFGIHVLYPLIKLLKLGKTINYEQASEIIGTHFPEVNDKLLNTLQLNKMISQNQSDLLVAGIEQKSEELRPIPFQFAIDFRLNKKYIKYLIVPLLIGGAILIISPAVLTDSSQRILQYESEFIPPAPFEFIIENETLQVPRNQDFNLEVNIAGAVVPSVVYVISGNQKQSMVRKGPRSFNFRFKNLEKDTEFKLLGDRYFSSTSVINVLPNPSLEAFDIRLNYPNYLNLKDKTLSNQGDLTVPEGTQIEWTVTAISADEVKLELNDSVFNLQKSSATRFTKAYQAKKTLPYGLYVTNKHQIGNDTLRFNLEVIPDLYPKINVSSKRDSNSVRLFYFTGQIEDDYGFKRLGFYYRVSNQASNWQYENVSLSSNTNQLRFGHLWQISDSLFKPGLQFEYYFKVTDNDGIRGGKSTSTPLFKINLPSIDSLREMGRAQDDNFKKELTESLDEARRLKEEFKELQMAMRQKKNIDWQDKKQVESLLNRQKKLEKKINRITQENKMNQMQQEEYDPKADEILKKQEEINRLFDELMSDEMKKLYEEIQELMEELNKEDLENRMDQIELSNEDLEKELDRALELFKQLEVEKEVNQTIDELRKLAKEQEKLAEESKSKEKSNDELIEKQKDLENSFDQMSEDFEKTLEKNKSLEKPMPLDGQKNEENAVKDEMNQSKENLENQKNKKASQNQKDAADKMKKMADNLAGQMQQGQQEALMEDMNALRKLLNNIIDLSLDHEALMNEVNVTGSSDPRFIELAQTQRLQMDDAKHIGDSLFALSKRIFVLESYVNREMDLVNRNMELSLEALADRSSQKAVMNQKYTMTSLNNLALLLDEAISKMQQQMASMMPGQGNCQKPGQGASKPSASDIKKMQDAMAKQLDELKKAMENVKKPGGEKKGNQPGMSKQIAQMAAKQAAIRNELEKMANELNEQGSGEGNELKKITRLMEENEQDLAKMDLTRQTMLRQQEISSRLLKAEKAEREREWDTERKSNSPKNPEISNPEQYSKYKEKKKNEAEMLETLPPNLYPYYKKKVSEYFNNLGTD